MINHQFYETTTPWDARVVRPRSYRWPGKAAARAPAAVPVPAAEGAAYAAGAGVRAGLAESDHCAAPDCVAHSNRADEPCSWNGRSRGSQRAGVGLPVQGAAASATQAGTEQLTAVPDQVATGENHQRRVQWCCGRPGIVTIAGWRLPASLSCSEHFRRGSRDCSA